MDSLWRPWTQYHKGEGSPDEQHVSAVMMWLSLSLSAVATTASASNKLTWGQSRRTSDFSGSTSNFTLRILINSDFSTSSSSFPQNSLIPERYNGINHLQEVVLWPHSTPWQTCYQDPHPRHYFSCTTCSTMAEWFQFDYFTLWVKSLNLWLSQCQNMFIKPALLSLTPQDECKKKC